MKHLSLFSGIGGFDLAAEWMGWENVAHCEFNPFARRILKHYWPNANAHTDITLTNFLPYNGKIDIITGGFPCQPFSVAGSGNGTDDPRYLWPEMFRAVREVRPRWVVAENVRGLISWNEGLVFDTVYADLESEGFEVWPFILPACAVNAPHRRERIWFVAHTAGGRSCGTPGEGVISAEGQNAKRAEQPGERREVRPAANAESMRINRAQEHENGNRQSGERRRRNPDNVGEIQRRDVITNADGGGREQVCNKLQRGQSDGNRVNANHQQNVWHSFPTQSPVCGGNDGVSRELDGITFSKWRNETIKAYGNAIVPQVAFQIFQSIAAFELTNVNT